MSQNIIACVYFSDENEAWIKQGVGSVSCENDPNGNRIIVVKDVNDPSRELVSSIINPDNAYVLETDNPIISWSDSVSEQTIALSFREEAGRDQINNEIRKITHPDSLSDDEDIIPQIIIPEPSLGSIKDIRQVFQSTNATKLQLLLPIIANNGQFIQQLCKLFKPLEDAEDQNNLSALASIFRNIVFLNDVQIFQILFRKDIFETFAAILEYDPEYGNLHPNHREFIQKKANFKQIVPITDESILDCIHQNFRIQYFRDAIIPTVSDDMTLSQVLLLQLRNISTIIQWISTNTEYLKKLEPFLQVLPINNNTIECLKYINEMLKMASMKEVDLPLKIDLVHGIIISIPDIIEHLHKIFNNTNDNKLKVLVLSITYDLFISQDEVLREEIALPKPPGIELDFRSLFIFIQNNNNNNNNKDVILQPPYNSFFYDIIREFWLNKDQGIKEQCNMMILGIGGEIMFANEQMKHQFLQQFYLSYIPFLMAALKNDVLLQKITQLSSYSSIHITLVYVIEIIISFIHLHTYHMKYYMPTINLGKKVIDLLKYNIPEISLAIIRFLKELINSCEKLYINQIISNNLLQPIFVLFKENGDKYNLLNSTILDMVQCVLDNDNVDLINHIVDNYKQYFEDVNYVNLFNKLVERYKSFKHQLTDDDYGSINKRKFGAIYLDNEREDSYLEEDDDSDDLNNSNNNHNSNSGNNLSISSSSDRNSLNNGDNDDDCGESPTKRQKS